MSTTESLYYSRSNENGDCQEVIEVESFDNGCWIYIISLPDMVVNLTMSATQAQLKKLGLMRKEKPNGTHLDKEAVTSILEENGWQETENPELPTGVIT